jgi:hypothetical protein
MPANGGMVMVVFYPAFVRLEDPKNVTIKDVVNHIDYIKNRIGNTTPTSTSTQRACACAHVRTMVWCTAS